MRTDIDLEEQSIESLRSERADLMAEQQPSRTHRWESTNSWTTTSRASGRRRASLESTIGALQDVVQFNEQMLDGDESAVVAELWTPGASDGAPTDQLIADQSVVCWTCGKRRPVRPD